MTSAVEPGDSSGGQVSRKFLDSNDTKLGTEKFAVAEKPTLILILRLQLNLKTWIERLEHCWPWAAALSRDISAWSRSFRAAL